MIALLPKLLKLSKLPRLIDLIKRSAPIERSVTHHPHQTIALPITPIYLIKQKSLSNKFFVRQVFVLYRKVCIFVLRAVQLYRKLKEKK